MGNCIWKLMWNLGKFVWRNGLSLFTFHGDYETIKVYKYWNMETQAKQCLMDPKGFFFQPETEKSFGRRSYSYEIASSTVSMEGPIGKIGRVSVVASSLSGLGTFVWALIRACTLQSCILPRLKKEICINKALGEKKNFLKSQTSTNGGDRKWLRSDVCGAQRVRPALPFIPALMGECGGTQPQFT